MTASYDNTAFLMAGCLRDAATGAVLRINSDGSVTLKLTGTRNASGTAITTKDWIPGTVRDPSTGNPMTVNSDGSINGAQS